MMASPNKPDNDYEEYFYQLIEFISRGPKKMKSIDIVPSNWIWYDPKKGKLVCKFMPPPYDAENNALLHSLIKTNANAPESWSVYPVKIIGRASEYIIVKNYVSSPNFIS